jgi:hypothetical protein
VAANGLPGDDGPAIVRQAKKPAIATTAIPAMRATTPGRRMRCVLGTASAAIMIGYTPECSFSGDAGPIRSDAAGALVGQVARPCQSWLRSPERLASLTSVRHSAATRAEEPGQARSIFVMRYRTAELASVVIGFASGTAMWVLLVVVTEKVTATAIVLMGLAACLNGSAIIRSLRIRRQPG